MADKYGRGSDLPTGRDSTGEPTGGGWYPPQGVEMDVRDHPDNSHDFKGEGLAHYSADSKTFWHDEGHNTMSPMETSVGSPSEKNTAISQRNKLQSAIDDMQGQLQSRSKMPPGRY